MRQNRHCQIYWQILQPEKNVMRSTVLEVRGHKSPLLLRGETWIAVQRKRRQRNLQQMRMRWVQRREAADAVRTAGTEFLSVPSLVCIILVMRPLQPIASDYRHNSHNLCLMRQNRHYQIFWLMCNWVGSFGFGLDIGAHNYKFLDMDWIWSSWKKLGSNLITKFPCCSVHQCFPNCVPRHTGVRDGTGR